MWKLILTNIKSEDSRIANLKAESSLFVSSVKHLLQMLFCDLCSVTAKR